MARLIDASGVVVFEGTAEGVGGALTVTDGSTPVTDVTEILFVGAVTGDNGGGIVEVDIPAPGLAAVLDENTDGGGNSMTNTGGISTGGGTLNTEGGTLDSGGGDLDLGTGTVISDLTIGSGHQIVVGGPNGIALFPEASTFDSTNAPEVPAIPTAQNIVDALIALGLVTQA